MGVGITGWARETAAGPGDQQELTTEPRDPQGAAVLFTLCPPLLGPVQGPTEGTRRTSSRCCRHEAAGDPHWRWGALSWGGSRHTARDTRKAQVLGRTQDCAFCPPRGPWGWRGPSPAPPAPAAPRPSTGVARGQRRVCSPLRGRRLLTEKQRPM